MINTGAGLLKCRNVHIRDDLDASGTQLVCKLLVLGYGGGGGGNDGGGGGRLGALGWFAVGGGGGAEGFGGTSDAFGIGGADGWGLENPSELGSAGGLKYAGASGSKPG